MLLNWGIPFNRSIRGRDKDLMIIILSGIFIERYDDKMKLFVCNIRIRNISW